MLTAGTRVGKEESRLTIIARLRLSNVARYLTQFGNLTSLSLTRATIFLTASTARREELQLVCCQICSGGCESV